jgi:microsomal epoxide hydrolase
VSVNPFRIAVPDADLADLAARLERTRWPSQPPGTGWEYGAPVGYLQELAEYWRVRFDWRAQEMRLGRIPQWTTEIDGANVHLLHARSPEPNALPLLLAHSWPGSVVEFLDLIGPLSDPRAYGGDPRDAFHVVVPSMPGFGFSGPTTTPWTMAGVARAYGELMRRLGHDRYAAHGGDFGSEVCRELAAVEPGHVVAIHVTHVFAASADPDDETEPRSAAAAARYRRELAGYAALQATRPQSVAYGLTDSPVAQLAWIVERFRDWTAAAGVNGVPEDAVDRDALLTNVMLYWLTRTAGSSARYYREGFTPPGPPPPVPAAVAVFPDDIAIPVRSRAEQVLRIARWTEFDRGGHFPAMEQPDLLLADLRASFRPYR